MMAEARQRILFGQRLHRLTLPLAALDVTAFLFIEIDQFGDPHFLAFGLELSGWIGAGGSTAKNFPGLSARLLRRQGSISANRRSEEHTSELQSLMRISYAAFCLKKKKNY